MSTTIKVDKNILIQKCQDKIKILKQIKESHIQWSDEHQKKIKKKIEQKETQKQILISQIANRKKFLFFTVGYQSAILIFDKEYFNLVQEITNLYTDKFPSWISQTVNALKQKILETEIYLNFFKLSTENTICLSKEDYDKIF